MSEFWKSNPRKYCEFCKCWIADNKPSVQFHEKGKKHKENVEKKIEEVKKKSIKDEKAKNKFENDMAAIEKAALAAAKKDLERDPSLASQYGVKLKPKDSDSYMSNNKAQVGGSQTVKSESKDLKKSSNESISKGIWYEAKTDEGHSYFWNDKTGESLWEPPSSYISLSGVKLENTEKSVADEKDEISRFISAKKDELNTKNSDKVNSDNSKVEEVIEKQDDTNVEKKIAGDPTSVSSIPLPGQILDKPVKRRHTNDRVEKSAYGSWTTCVRQDNKPLELDLPDKGPQIEVKVPVFKEKPKIKFKEKKVVSLTDNTDSSSSSVSFKKRKFNPGSRNIRRGDDSD